MNFLIRFLKVFLILLIVSALGAFAFYEIVIAGHKLSADVSPDQFRTTVYTVIGAWLGFIIFISFVLALVGMKATISVPVSDRNYFLQRAHNAITSLRYRPSSQTENLLVYKPPAGRFLMEKISVQLGQGAASITAPRNLLKRIQQQI